MSSPMLKKRKVENDRHARCIICKEDCDEKQKNPTNEQWKEFKDTATEWAKVRGKFSSVSERVNWQAGPTGHYWHKTANGR